MKKVLIIANLFHASPRIPGIATYLPEFGWEATIVTPPLGEEYQKDFSPPKSFFKKIKLIEVPYKGDVLWFPRKIIKKLIGFKSKKGLTEKIKERMGISSRKSLVDKLLFFYQAIFGYPDTEKPWIKPVLKNISKLSERYDAILSSSPYPTSHIIAHNLQYKLKIPWVADFRDCWSQNFFYPYGFFRKILDTKLEKKVLRNSSIITAATPGIAAEEEKLNKKASFTITNGFDPELMMNDQAFLLDKEKLTITYTGRIYPGKQDPIKFLLAIKELIDENKIEREKIKVQFFGEPLMWLENEIKKMGLSDVVFQYSSIPREEIFQKQKNSHILLLLCWEDETQKEVYPKKFFEYLISGRPILATGGTKDETIKKIISETKTGVSALNIKEIKEKILFFYQEFIKTGEVPYHGDLKKIEQYSYRSMAKKFAELLNQITK